jgi:hypothetical protein
MSSAIVDGIAGRIEYTQIQPELDGLVGKFVPSSTAVLSWISIKSASIW